MRKIRPKPSLGRKERARCDRGGETNPGPAGPGFAAETAGKPSSGKKALRARYSAFRMI